MSVNEYYEAVGYSWMTFTQRRVDYWLSKAFGDGKDTTKNSSGTIDWTNMNPVAKALKLQEIKDGTKIPPYIKKEKV